MVKNNKEYPNLIILDVRNPQEYNLGHLYNAILIPYDELEPRISELEVYNNTEIIVYCKSGYKSQLASEILVEYGFTKVYNMLGGILAWIDADYPIWTTSHYIIVDEITSVKFEVLIEPLLLHFTGCSSCSENHACPSDSAPIELTSTVLEQEDNYKVILVAYESNGITYENIFTYTLLWNYSKTTSKFNETAYFISTEIATENMYIQFYRLIYLKQHEDYNLTIHTHLDPLYSETYNNSFTYIKYTPANGKAITSMEFVQFNISVILSQQYDILADIAKKMAKIYKKSEDLDIKELYYAYIDMKEGITSLSKLVKEQLVEYDWLILESFAILTDYVVPPNGNGTPPPPPPPDNGNLIECAICIVACDLAVLLGCVIACWFYAEICKYCVAIMDYMEALNVGCEIACEWLGAC